MERICTTCSAAAVLDWKYWVKSYNLLQAWTCILSAPTLALYSGIENAVCSFVISSSAFFRRSMCTNIEDTLYLA